MTDYQLQAINFLKETDTTMDIRLIGQETNKLWNESTPRNKYSITLKNSRHSYTFDFWDSLHNTAISNITFEQFFNRKWQQNCNTNNILTQSRARAEFEKEKEEAKPTEYDILACLTPYPVGTMDDFMQDYGYEIKCAKDMSSFLNIYNAVGEEYSNLCKLFTAEQLDELREIQ